ncbi:MAG: proton-conducting transporter membrane subunit [Prosthecobacter sp.]|uniref:proton-conducting transporter transmembrane domain-containing protein n=1 Tax=Prosthecobacter sp. TaxID=1965333 RepID=UPI003901FB15
MPPEKLLLLILVATPGVLFLSLGLLWLLGGAIPERAMSRLTKGVYALLTIVVGMIAWQMWQTDTPSIHVSLGNWFTVGHYGFPLSLLIDRLSLPIVGITVVLTGIVGAFSVRYLHRDPGFHRFFLQLHLFSFGALLIFTANSLDLLIAGWELVGITSVLLIGFFQYRPDPVRNALRVFGIYRIADLNLLLAVFLAHHWFGTASWDAMFSGEWPGHVSNLNDNAVSVIAVLLVFAASGKSSQGPFCGWLPRAMEGPTPSSAIFYGAISVHAGAYLLLRVEPIIRSSWFATGLVIFIGLTTAVLGTLVHRTCADAKTSLAYASQTQLGLIFAEIGLGWTTLAIIHIIGHAMVRTLQFLRAPSMLHDHHRLHAAAGGHLAPTGAQYDSFLPKYVQLWLYRFALGRGFYDSIVDRFVIAPVLCVARFLAIFDLQGTTPPRGNPDV